MPTKLVEFCYKSGQVSADVWWWKEVIEAVDPTHIHLTSMLYIYKVFDNLYMLWMCHMDVSPPSYGRSCRPSLWNFATNLGKSQLMWWWNEVIEAVDPTHIHLTSMLYIYEVFDNLYMLWMCIWMCPHQVTAAHADQACGILLQIWASPNWCDGDMRWLRL